MKFIELNPDRSLRWSVGYWFGFIGIGFVKEGAGESTKEHLKCMTDVWLESVKMFLLITFCGWWNKSVQRQWQIKAFARLVRKDLTNPYHAGVRLVTNFPQLYPDKDSTIIAKVVNDILMTTIEYDSRGVNYVK